MSSSYGGKRVYNGEIIEIDSKHFSERWMEKIKAKPGPKAKAKPESLSLSFEPKSED
jgi:hypothetical protein